MFYMRDIKSDINSENNPLSKDEAVFYYMKR